MEILRSHSSEPYSPEKGSMKDICMHYGGLTRPSQTASSQISELGKGMHWFTGTSLPCLSIFKPIFFETPLELGERPTNKYNPKSYVFFLNASPFRAGVQYSQTPSLGKRKLFKLLEVI